MDKKLGIENKEINKGCVDKVIARLQDIEDTSVVGVVAAQDIIDIVIENLGPEIYNKAINDSNKLIQVKLEDLANEIEGLQQ